MATVKKSKAGRASLYRDEYPAQALKLCRLGATNPELADFFKVAVSTLSKWLAEIPEFSDALKEGREIANANVASRLYERAMGYSHPEDKIFNNNGEALIVPTTKHYPPDTTAAIFWLKNRCPAQWRDRVEEQKDTGNLAEALN